MSRMLVDVWKQLEEYYKSLQLNENDTRDLAQLTRLYLYSSSNQSNEPDVLSYRYNVDNLIQMILKFVDVSPAHHYPPPSTDIYHMKPCHEPKENDSEDELEDDFCGYPIINIRDIDLNEPAPFEEIKDGIFYRLNEFICDYNKDRAVDRQINGDEVFRCFMDNRMDYTKFKDLNRNLRPLGIKAGPVRKLWKSLKSLPIGSYIYIEYEHEYEGIVPGDNDDDEFIPREYEHEGIEFEDNDEYLPPEYYNDEGIQFQVNEDANNGQEFIQLEIGENLSVPSDWSDDE